MKKRLLLVCPVLLFAVSAWGSTCANTTLNNYLGSGFSCTSANGDFLFSGFSYAPDAVTGQPPANDVTVKFVDDGINEGFTFSGAWAAAAGQSSDAQLNYSVQTAGALAGQNVITGNTAALNSYGASGGGNVHVVEAICTTAPSMTTGCPKANATSLDAFYDSGHPPAIPSTLGTPASVTFASPTNVDYMSKNIIINGDGGISVFTNTVQVSNGGAGTGGSPVPEPGSTVMIGSGLILTSLLLRKKIRRIV